MADANELVPDGRYGPTKPQKGWSMFQDKDKPDGTPGNDYLKLIFPVKVIKVEEKTDEKTGAKTGVKTELARTVQKKCYFNGGALDITLRDLYTMGADPKMDVGELIGLLAKGEGGIDKNDIEVNVGHEDFKGKTYNKVNYIDPVGGRPEVERASSVGRVLALGARLKGYQLPAKDNGSPNGKASTKAKDEPKPPVEPADDEIPF